MCLGEKFSEKNCLWFVLLPNIFLMIRKKILLEFENYFRRKEICLD